MLISLAKDSSQPGEILAHVHVSASDDPATELKYSHSFRYKVPSGKDGEILVYADQETATKDVKGDVFPFNLEECNDLECHKRHCQKKKHRHCGKKVKDCEVCKKEIRLCKKTNKNECSVIAGKGNRFLVADVFHTMPTQNTLQDFGAALFKALFSGEAGRLLQETKPTHQNGQIYLQLDDQGLDAIPWEYAKDGATFLVHSRKFIRVVAREYERLPNQLPKLPLRIVVAAPDPLDLTELKLADLHLGDQVQNFINEFHGKSIKIMLEPVLPATVDKMNSLLAKHNDKTATVFHFMGHCVSHKDDKGARGLLFEDEETFQCKIAQTQNLVTIPTNLRLAFLSACDSREVARDLAQNGVRHTIGSYCPLPDDLARKSEAQFYHFLALGLSVNEAMWRTRVYYQRSKDLRQSDYLAGAMILYSTTCQMADNTFLCEPGKLIIERNMFPNNLNIIPSPKKFFGRKKQLAELNGILRRMVTRTNDSFEVCTITGIGGQGKTTLAIEAIQRTSHFFPGGIFVWQFDDGKKISAQNFLQQMNNILFSVPVSKESSADEMETLGQVISNQFKASCLLVLDHAETLKHAADEKEENAVFLVDWLWRNISRRDIAVKILATSQEVLRWQGEKVFRLDGFTDSDIRNGCKFFIESLHSEAKEKMKEEKNRKDLLYELVKSLDGHPLSLKLLASAASLTQHSYKSLKDIVDKHNIMLADVNYLDKSLEKCFGPMIDRLPKLQCQILYLCCLFTGPITDRVLLFLSYFLDHSADDFSTETIMTQLPILYETGLLKQTIDNLYSIHAALKEAVSQRNADLHLCLYLQPSGNYANTFVIGVLTSSPLRKSKILQWLFYNIKSNHSSHLQTKNFGIEYYSLNNMSWTIINLINIDNNFVKATIQHTLPTQLIVFIYKVSKIIQNNIYQFCEDQISIIVTKRKLPFILCFDYTNAEVSIEIALKKVAILLQKSLIKSHEIIITDVSSKEKKADRISSTASTQSDNLDNKMALRAYQKSFTNIHMEGDFVGRKNELEMLHILLSDNIHHYITIKGFGGMGKTCLAIQAAKNFNSGSILALSLIGTPTLSSVIRKIAQFLSIETKELSPQEQQDIIFEKIDSRETILLYLDNMEDIKNTADRGNLEAKDLMRFFQQMPKNIKILATSRVTLGWPNEKIVELDGLTSQDGMQVFRQWVSQRNNEVDDDSAMKLSNLVHGHSLSIRLLGGVFDNCGETMDRFLGNVHSRLSTAVDNNSTNNRHKSIDTCIEYSFRNLDPVLRSLLGQLKLFEIPFCKTIVMRALGMDITLIANNLHNLWQRSWLNQHIYQENPMLGDWRPRSIENDTKFYSLHPRLRDFLDEEFKDANFVMLNDHEIQFYTALCYGVGFGVVNNLNKQIEWCTKAATNGHLEAQLALAACYKQGAGGVSEDLKMAFDWYLKAAKVGDKGALQQMEACYKEMVESCKHAQVSGNKSQEIKFDLSLPLLHRAVEYNQVKLVRSLMDQPSVNVNVEDRHGQTPLYIAAEKGHIELLNVLGVEFNADVNTKDKEGRSPLHRAAENKHVEVVQLLVTELGADINAEANDGQTPLHYLARDGYTEIMMLLLTTELRVNTKAKDNEQTPLHLAAANGHIEFVRLLVTKLGVDTNIRDSNGQTPLHLAVDNGHIEVVRLLVADLGTDDKRMLLFRAVGNGLVEIMRLLITDLKVDANTRDRDGQTLLHRAADNGQLKVIKLLVAELGIDVDVKDYKRQTPLHVAAYNGRVDVIMLLISELKADINAKDNDGRTPVYQAIDNGHVEVTRLFVTKIGMDITAQGENGVTQLLHWAAKGGHLNVMRLLVAELGADVNPNKKGVTPFHWAAKGGHVEVMSVLESEFGANANVKDEENQTPLHWALNSGQIEALKFLMAKMHQLNFYSMSEISV